MDARCNYPLSSYFEDIIKRLDPDASRDGLKGTPARMERFYTEFLNGYYTDVDRLVKEALFDSDGYGGMVLVKNIPFYSLCEHHLLPFKGVAHIAYFPTKKVVGLSKLARIVDAFSHRLQVQERLTQQIADTVSAIPGNAGTGVLLSAEHLCMAMRGVEKYGTLTDTEIFTGRFLTSDGARSEFYSRIN